MSTPRVIRSAMMSRPIPMRKSASVRTSIPNRALKRRRSRVSRGAGGAEIASGGWGRVVGVFDLTTAFIVRSWSCDKRGPMEKRRALTTHRRLASLCVRIYWTSLRAIPLWFALIPPSPFSPAAREGGRLNTRHCPFLLLVPERKGRDKPALSSPLSHAVGEGLGVRARQETPAPATNKRGISVIQEWTMATSGYYRFPAIYKDTLVFTSEDDLWTVPAAGGVARRLTANLGTISHPFFSPDGATLAFTGREEGHNEVYVMPAEGGPVRRVTYLGVNSIVLGWTLDGSQILFASDSGQPFDRLGVVYAVRPEGGLPERWPIGPAVSISLSAGNRIVIGRNNNDPARWKRYRGGTAGDIWIDAEGNGEFRRLLTLNGNIGRPMWIGERIFFLSDHEGVGNLYSCTPSGEDLRRHTHRQDYFVRFPSTDGQRIVYHAGADLYVYDPKTSTESRVEVAYYSPRVPRQRKF